MQNGEAEQMKEPQHSPTQRGTLCHGKQTWDKGKHSRHVKEGQQEQRLAQTSH